MKTKTELRNRLTGALAILGLLAGGLAFAGTASAASDPNAEFFQVCYDAWDDAPASDYCTENVILRHSLEGTDSYRGHCFITGISCSVSATNQAAETVTWTASGDITKSPSDTETLHGFQHGNVARRGLLHELGMECAHGTILRRRAGTFLCRR